MIWAEAILVGRIARPHGNRGAVVVNPESDFSSERFRPGAELWWMDGERPALARVAASREFRGRWVVTFEGVASMTDAESLRGRELRVEAGAAHELAAGRFYLHDLRRCRVVTMNGDEVGQVVDVLAGSGTPVLVISDPDGREVMVPLAEEICRVIDPTRERIVIDPPAGLIGLNRAAE